MESVDDKATGPLEAVKSLTEVTADKTPLTFPMETLP
jgi:hypothetical protein